MCFMNALSQVKFGGYAKLKLGLKEMTMGNFGEKDEKVQNTFRKKNKLTILARTSFCTTSLAHLEREKCKNFQ